MKSMRQDLEEVLLSEERIQHRLDELAAEIQRDYADKDLLSLGLPLATGGKLTCIRGGLPLMVDGQCVGGIGVSAGTEEEDVQVAQAGVAALAKLI